jgi:hypothetical protein
MILKNRLYERKDPFRDAKLFIIYCEGKRREPEYFSYFNEISSRIKLEIIPAEHRGDNSPTGLYEQACFDTLDVGENPGKKYDIDKDDQIWFVIDTDEWGQKIEEMKLVFNLELLNYISLERIFILL